VGTSTVLAAQASQILLSEEVFAPAMRDLARRDADLAAGLEKYGPPPLGVRDPGFPTLVYIILEQQVLGFGARPLSARSRAALHTKPFPPTRRGRNAPPRLQPPESPLHRLLAEAIKHRRLDLRSLHDLPDHRARERLIACKGIGSWTADIYLLSAVRRPDIWPVGDLALSTAVQKVKRLRKRPRPRGL
jgi:DNA-3-methyladenine glycosylase II